MSVPSMKGFPAALAIAMGMLVSIGCSQGLPHLAPEQNTVGEAPNSHITSSIIKFSIEGEETEMAPNEASKGERRHLIVRNIEPMNETLSTDATIRASPGVDDTAPTLRATPVQISASWVLVGVVASESGVTAHLVRGSIGDPSTLARATTQESFWRRLLRRVLVAFGANRRITSSNALEQETRRAIYRLLHQRPGLYAGEIGRKLDVSRQTVTYHLRILEDIGLIYSKLDGRRYYYCNGATSSGNDPPPISPTCREIVGHLHAGLNTKTELADVLDITPRGVGYHLARLVDRDVVERNREGPRNEYTLSPKGERFLPNTST